MFFADVYKSVPVLVTGHTGFKGSWLSSWLLRLGANVCGFSKDIPTSPSLFELAALSNQMEHRVGDVRHLNVMNAAVQSLKPRFIFHLAA